MLGRVVMVMVIPVVYDKFLLIAMVGMVVMVMLMMVMMLMLMLMVMMMMILTRWYSTNPGLHKTHMAKYTSK